ncbi:DUF998 domain-containing protein [Demequina sp. SYSU T00039]|uniref:DUF998 domain-containing protein n=1 Tax=Demequina lignilytica TaxID=3051663 RepID=A0AAW7M7V5_9MICO|nr:MULTISPECIES: DUF998 domain-containing protein [unclassified Demequina]MDN4479218.1 DUF998 domain-containing protein [Demequina sp. SYSU T00039-1]MDN4487923.1 DUF998 domain-containing protein [Demequina sp. SYSU T00039]MDN4491729.1 DUF998 domain-containing protein [Demequina sp. SYSU T00068]
MSTSPASSGQPMSTRVNTATELTAMGLGAVAYTAVAGIALLVFGFDDAPIAGEGSVGTYAALASAVATMLAFAAGRYALHLRGGPRITGALDVIDVAVLALAHGVIALLGWTLVARIMAESFIDATVFWLPILALSGAAAAVSAYVAFLSATHLDAQLLAVVLATFLVLGIIASMLTASDPHWWEENLSSLGITSDLSALAFNLTLIVAGFLLTVLARYATRAIPTAEDSSVGRVRLTLIVIGVFLGCVGIFKVDTQFWIHTAVASGMAIAFAVLTIRLKAWIPGISRAFLPVGWLFFGVIFVLAVMFAIGYYTLTAVELVAGVLIFAWIILFLRTVGALDADVGRDEALAES